MIRKTDTSNSTSESNSVRNLRSRPIRDNQRIGHSVTHQDDTGRDSTHPNRELQRRHGNSAIQRFIKNRVQPKHRSDRADTGPEQEAARVADAIATTSDPRGIKPTKDSPTDYLLVDGLLENGVREKLGEGQPLPQQSREFFEERFDHNLRGVRLHTDSRAAALTSELDARAFTIGRNIVFNRSEFAPESPGGSRLLAHELTHVIQQGAGRDRSLRPETETIQRKVAIGGADLDRKRLQAVQDKLVTDHLSDIVQQVGGKPRFDRRYREQLVRDTVADMHAVGTRFSYSTVTELARDVKQRVLVSLYMRKSQGYKRRAGGRTQLVSGFSYPDRESDGTEGITEKVNDAAQQYWDGPKRGSKYRSNYWFTLTAEGKKNAYEAIKALFTPQRDPKKRTLIHCDYLVSVVEYRAWVESVGRRRFNTAVEYGYITPVLKYNGFADLARTIDLPAGFAPEAKLPKGFVDLTTTPETPHRRVTVNSEDDLVIGDHVWFYNHESYDALIEGVDGIWRLENAIVVDHRSGENRYQGHGYYSPVPKSRLLHGMIRQYNKHVRAARKIVRKIEAAERNNNDAAEKNARQELSNKYPNVVEFGNDWWILGEGFCNTVVTRELKRLSKSEAPGLEHPCSGDIRIYRPEHTASP